MINQEYKISFRVVSIVLCIIAAVFFATCTADAASIVSETESNDTMGAANYINVYEKPTIKGDFNSDEDVDFYTFTVEQGGLLTMKFKYYGEKPAKYYGNYELLRYELYSAEDPEQYLSYRVAEYNSNLGYASAEEKYYTSAGIYYLKVKGIGTNDYEISVEAMDAYEDFAEPNNYIGQATELQEGKILHGVMAENKREGEDSDFFKISADEEGIYEITLRNNDIGGDSDRGNCLGMFAYDASGNSIDLFYKENKGNQSWCYVETPHTQESQRVHLLKGDTYIKVGTLGQWGYYEISYKKVKGQDKLIKEAIINTQITSLKVKTSAKRKVTMTWSKSQSTYAVSGYEIRRSMKKTSGFKKIATTIQRKYTDTKVKFGKTYWYKVRCYKDIEDGARVYGKWRQIKVKVK